MLSKFLNLIATHANSLYIPLTFFIFFDYITGVCLSIKNKKVSSKIGFVGIMRKALIYLVAILGRIIDQFVLSSGTSIESMILLFYLSNEGISILENLTQLGIPFPEKVKQIFSNLGKDN